MYLYIHHKLESYRKNVIPLFQYLIFIDDHSRVVLSSSTAESNYINANYIQVSLKYNKVRSA